MDDLEGLDESLVSFDIETEPDGSAMVRIGGELDLGSIERLESEVDRLLASAPSRLVVDVGDVRFADSSAIALWVRWATAVPRFELRDSPPLLRRVITAMGLSTKLGVAS